MSSKTASAYTSVDEYVAAQTAEVRPALQRVRAAIRKAVPEATEIIKYNMPTYELGRKRLLHFAAWKDHYALYVSTKTIVAEFKDQLGDCEIDKGTIRFPIDRPVPERLIGRIAKFRAR